MSNTAAVSETALEKDVEQLNPVHIVVVALAGVVIFIGGLIFLATWVAGK